VLGSRHKDVIRNFKRPDFGNHGIMHRHPFQNGPAIRVFSVESPENTMKKTP
jgi:hypothetical protein